MDKKKKKKRGNFEDGAMLKERYYGSLSREERILSYTTTQSSINVLRVSVSDISFIILFFSWHGDNVLKYFSININIYNKQCF